MDEFTDDEFCIAATVSRRKGFEVFFIGDTSKCSLEVFDSFVKRWKCICAHEEEVDRRIVSSLFPFWKCAPEKQQRSTKSQPSDTTLLPCK